MWFLEYISLIGFSTQHAEIAADPHIIGIGIYRMCYLHTYLDGILGKSNSCEYAWSGRSL